MFNYKKHSFIQHGGSIVRPIIGFDSTKVEKKIDEKTILKAIKEFIFKLAIAYYVAPEVILLAIEFLGVPLGNAIQGRLGNFFAAMGMNAQQIQPQRRQNLIRQAMNVVHRIRANPNVLRVVLSIAENLGNAYNAIHDRYYFPNRVDIPADVHIPDMANLLAVMGPPVGINPADIVAVGLPPAYAP